jgi:hypothetical protein
MTPVSFSRYTLVLSAAALLAVTLGPVSNAAPRSRWTQVSSDRLIQGQAPIGAWARGDERCFDYPKYTVSESFANNTASKGEASLITTIAVRAASTQCKQINGSNQDKPIFVIKKGFEFFQGLANNVLITDSGSGPDGRTLTLYAIDKQSKILEFNDYSDGDLALKNNKLILWRKTGYATKQTCPQYKQWVSQGLGAVIESQVIVDLDTYRVLETSSRRCQPRQSRNPEQKSASLRLSVIDTNQPV